MVGQADLSLVTCAFVAKLTVTSPPDTGTFVILVAGLCDDSNRHPTLAGVSKRAARARNTGGDWAAEQEGVHAHTKRRKDGRKA